jgi:DNA-binding NtrC family response regulator
MEPVPSQIRKLIDSVQTRVLIIEDEAGPRIALNVLLEPFYQLHFAANAAEAFQLLHEYVVNLIIQDMHVPGTLQGLGLLQELREQHPHIPVLILTGYSMTSSKECERIGAAAYLLKPFGIDDLLNTVRHLLHQEPVP